MVGSSAARDAGLGQLIRLKNYKQALKNVDKKLKKQTNDYDLLVMRLVRVSVLLCLTLGRRP